MEQLTLGDLIDYLSFLDPNHIFEDGFAEPNSYRGYYDQLAFEPVANTTAGDMLTHCCSAVNKVFTGYKGGEFKMDMDTPVWVAEYGSSNGRPIVRGQDVWVVKS